jgi:ribosomal protein S18 acetylase RimI-like enzyme
VTDLTLAPMTQEFYDTWMAALEKSYGQDHVQAGNWSADEAPAKARAETDTLLPDGLQTKDHLLLCAFNDDGEMVGALWIAVREEQRKGAWIYEIEVFEQHRGSGYGRALLVAAEQATKAAGAESLGLNVFGPNAKARALYESSGFEITTMQMRKVL